MAEVASAFVQLVPSFKGGSAAISKELGGSLEGAGAQGGKRLGGGILGAAKGFIAPLAGVFAVSAAKDFFGDAISGASNLNEASTKITAIFGDASSAVNKFADQGAAKLGQTKLQVLDASASFGTFGKAAGLAGPDLANFSTGLAGLSTDLASFYNTDPAQAAQAISAGLRGESEPLRQYGVLLDDATLKTEAMKLGLIKTTKEALTPQQKVLAAQSAIYKQTKDAQGDFGRTSGGLANQQRILSAQFEGVKTSIGSALLPVAVKFVTFLNNGLGPAITAVTGFLGPVVDMVKLFIGSFTGAGADVGNVPFMNTIIDLGAQVRGVFDKLGPAVSGLVGSFKGAVGQLQDGFQRIMPTIGGIISGIVAVIVPLLPRLAVIFGGILSVITAVLQVIGRVVSVAVTAIVWVWETFGATILGFITTVFQAVIGVIEPAINFVRAIITTVLALLSGDWSGAWAGLLSVLSAAWSLIASVVTGALSIVWGVIKAALSVIGSLFISVFGGLVRTVVGAMTSFGAAVNNGIRAAVGFVASLPGRILSALGALGSLLVSLGSRLLGGLLSGITGAAGGIWSYLSGIPGTILSQLGDLGSLLVSAGGSLISGLISGISSQGGALMGFIVQFMKDHVPGPILSFFNIGSPSKLMAGIGKQIPAGFALGIASGAADVEAAVNAIIPAIPSSGPLGFGGRSSLGGAASSTGPLIAVYPRANQSEDEIATIAAGKLMFRLASA